MNSNGKVLWVGVAAAAGRKVRANGKPEHKAKKAKSAVKKTAKKTRKVAKKKK